MTCQQVLAELRKDRIFYEDSGGGVTFSGGEPLMQPEFLRELLVACRCEGFHTALDTSGYAAQDAFLAIAPLADVILYDLKVMDDARHIQYTGVSNARILDNLQAIARIHRAIWLRIPIVPGLNDDAANIEAAARLAGALPNLVKVCLLPYHKTGAAKFDRLGQPYQLEQVEPPSPEHMEELAGHFRVLGINTQAGG